MKNADINWKNLTLPETIRQLKKEANEFKLERKEEVETSREVEFLLTYKGRRLLCRMDNIPPFTIRYRLVGTKNYERCKPKNFVEMARQILLH